MKTRVYLLIIVLFLAGSLTAQPYDTPPFLSSNVISSEYFEIGGKKYYLAELSYSSLSPNDYDKQKSKFEEYLEESFALRGATRTMDSLAADFFVRVRVNYGDSSSEDFQLTNKKLNIREPANEAYLTNPSGYSSENKSDIITITETHKGKTYVVNGKKYYPNTYKDCIKSISVEAYSAADNPKLLFVSEVFDIRGDFKFLSPDEFMLFALSESYGRKINEKRLVVAPSDMYYNLFKNLELDLSMCYSPDGVSSSKKVGLFLIEKKSNKLVLVIEDKNCLALDDKGRNLVPSLRVGDKIINSTKASYGVPHVIFARLLTIEFPAIEGEAETIDLIFHKSGQAEKPKYSIKGIKIYGSGEATIVSQPLYKGTLFQEAVKNYVDNVAINVYPSVFPLSKYYSEVLFQLKKNGS